MRTLDATRWGTFRRVEFPAALPSLFSGARVAATFAAIGAVFGEWAGSTNGLGYVMTQATPQLETALVFAAIAILTVVSVALFAAVHGVQRLCAPWSRSESR
jgi:putative hydroxymethylpyrimidine transport system permease protein